MRLAVNLTENWPKNSRRPERLVIFGQNIRTWLKNGYPRWHPHFSRELYYLNALSRLILDWIGLGIWPVCWFRKTCSWAMRLDRKGVTYYILSLRHHIFGWVVQQPPCQQHCCCRACLDSEELARPWSRCWVPVHHAWSYLVNSVNTKAFRSFSMAIERQVTKIIVKKIQIDPFSAMFHVWSCYFRYVASEHAMVKSKEMEMNWLDTWRQNHPSVWVFLF